MCPVWALAVRPAQARWSEVFMEADEKDTTSTKANARDE